jgi:hypothetical protein
LKVYKYSGENALNVKAVVYLYISTVRYNKETQWGRESVMIILFELGTEEICWKVHFQEEKLGSSSAPTEYLPVVIVIQAKISMKLLLAGAARGKGIFYSILLYSIYQLISCF